MTRQHYLLSMKLINWKELIVDIVDEIYYGDIVDTELDESQVNYLYWWYYEGKS